MNHFFLSLPFFCKKTAEQFRKNCRAILEYMAKKGKSFIEKVCFGPAPSELNLLTAERLRAIVAGNKKCPHSTPKCNTRCLKIVLEKPLWEFSN
jgi:hypothetical protein